MISIRFLHCPWIEWCDRFCILKAPESNSPLLLPSNSWAQRSSPPVSNGMLPPQVKSGSGTTAGMVLNMIEDVEIAISSRKGQLGTAAGDVAFSKGKENLTVSSLLG
ncbi:hypothetical protein SLEP1_g27010 [Rubroshorea leprosula]|uniref:Uncharacterized protein n=1 Tax=Rubroshorea leprosula TaxID=152421 RepID=A0AAV5JYA0_9ROSI|nr:hypothetical protein SLEP1_g27010 [Rubroshorea leprosula]